MTSIDFKLCSCPLWNLRWVYELGHWWNLALQLPSLIHFILLAYRSNPLGYATARCKGFPAWEPRPLWSSTPQQMQVKLNSIDGHKWHTSNRLWKLICSDQLSLICRFHWLLWINCDLLQSTSFVSGWRFTFSNQYARSIKTHLNSCRKIHSNLCFTWSNVDRKDAFNDSCK